MRCYFNNYQLTLVLIFKFKAELILRDLHVLLEYSVVLFCLIIFYNHTIKAAIESSFEMIQCLQMPQTNCTWNNLQHLCKFFFSKVETQSSGQLTVLQYDSNYQLMTCDSSLEIQISQMKSFHIKWKSTSSFLNIFSNSTVLYFIKNQLLISF